VRRANPRLDDVDLHVELAHPGRGIRVGCGTSSGGSSSGGGDVLPRVGIVRCLLPVAVAQLGRRKVRHEGEAREGIRVRLLANARARAPHRHRHRRRQDRRAAATAADDDDFLRAWDAECRFAGDEGRRAAESGTVGGWYASVCDSKGTSEQGQEDVLHVDVFACVVLQTAEETGGRDRADGAGPGQRRATRAEPSGTDEVTQAGTVATLGPRREGKSCK
jgi:hypothetical protein